MNKTTFAHGQLKSLVERIERLEEEKKLLGDDIKDIYTEAKSAGYDVKVLRKLVAERKLEAEEVREARCLLELYRQELTRFETTPLGKVMASGAAGDDYTAPLVTSGGFERAL
jgi:uncharacterized protein (UPF0335 family)